MQEQITDQHLRDVFNEIKGGTAGRLRACINFEDFKRVCYQYKPACLKQMILEGAVAEVNAELEEHFRNICESCSPVFDTNDTNDHDSSSPKFANKDIDEDLLCDLGNNSLDEGTTVKPMPTPTKKLKQKPEPSSYRGKTASRAMQRPKSPMNTMQQKTGGPQPVPSIMGKKSPSSPLLGNTVPMPSTSPQWIEDIPVEDMKLYFDNFKQCYAEFDILTDLVREVLASMGIIFRRLSSKGHGGVHTNRFSEFDDQEEQEMDDEGVY